MIQLFFFLRYRCRSIWHEISAFITFRKGNHIFDRFRFAHDCNQPVQTEGYSAVRRCPTPQRFDQVTQCGKILFQYRFQNVLLHLCLMDAHRATADFTSIQNEIVMLPSDSKGITSQEVNVIGMRCSERVMGRFDSPLIIRGQEQREIAHPQKVEAIASQFQSQRFEPVRHLEPQFAHARHLRGRRQWENWTMIFRSRKRRCQ